MECQGHQSSPQLHQSPMEISRFALFLFATILIFGLCTEAGSAGEALGWLVSTGSGGCRGTTAECLGGEFMMDTEINRRILASVDNLLSYQVLSPDKTAASCPAGYSYYNNQCGPNPNPNPNIRPCSKAAGCRS
ncbi:hypothetical protein SAY87_007651 [Trapa incisa]|uniref:Uncharacterized protein n=1 Tax=Trapa incisa TaxID=236973 RepID=A0AAN7QFI6_9MYRT|nr:hypothetical protein SAY87_007651 [Trapa incisa]